MAVSRTLHRNVRPKHAEEAVEIEDEGSHVSDRADEAAASDGSLVDIDGDDSEGERTSAAEDEDVEQRLSNVSFGALKQAQDSLSRKRKRGSDETPDQEGKLEALRARLRQIKGGKETSSHAKPSRRDISSEQSPKPANGAQSRRREGKPLSEEDHSDTDSPPSEEDLLPSKSRTSKHAPTAQSSRHQVTRKRTVIAVPKSTARDPRFDAMSSSSSTGTHAHAPPAAHTAHAYSFLRDYQKSEIAELAAALKRSRNDDEREVLRRNMVALQNRVKAKEAAEREQEVVKRHRREEREKVEEGKRPFYLKRKAVREQALVERFKGMKGKEKERAVERRRLRESQKEKRRMPRERRQP